MGKASTQSKQRWNSENYTQVKVSVAPEVASAFKAACASSDVSMASKLSTYMMEYSNAAQKGGRSPDYATKRQRRAAVRSIAQQLELIKIAEEKCRDNTPESLQGSVNYENAEQSVSLLEEVIELLTAIY